MEQPPRSDRPDLWNEASIRSKQGEHHESVFFSENHASPLCMTHTVPLSDVNVELVVRCAQRRRHGMGADICDALDASERHCACQTAVKSQNEGMLEESEDTRRDRITKTAAQRHVASTSPEVTHEGRRCYDIRRHHRV